MAMAIPFVRLILSLPTTGWLAIFLGVATGRIVSGHAQDVGLMAFLVDGILHRLAVDG
jgi:hypothetical protein